MMTTNLLHIHIISYRILQLMMRWWLRFTLSGSFLWGSCTLDKHILIKFWGGLLQLLMSWISHVILVSVRFQWRGFDSFWCMCLSRSIIDCSWFVTEASSTSTTLVQNWSTNVGFTITVITRLRCFMQGDCLVQPRHAWCLLLVHSSEMNVFQQGENDEDINRTSLS